MQILTSDLSEDLHQRKDSALTSKQVEEAKKKHFHKEKDLLKAVLKKNHNKTTEGAPVPIVPPGSSEAGSSEPVTKKLKLN